MSCPVVTDERLAQLLEGRLPDEDKRAVAAHLKQPCEDCLQLLADVEGAALLSALAGPGAKLSAAEADRMFAATREPLATRLWRWLTASPGGRLSLAFALLLIIVVPIALRPREMREKGSAVNQVSLQAFVKRGDAPPSRYAGEPLRAGEALLFRYRLEQPAWLYLVDEHGEVLWDGGRVEAGEGEIDAGGQALALPGPYAGEVRLFAAPRPEKPADCRDCAVDRLSLPR